MKKLIIILVVVAVVSILAIPSVLFADSHKVSTFVCPVLKDVGTRDDTSNAFEKSTNFFPIGDDYSILPGKAGGDPGTHLNSPVSVPIHATNDNGDGSPGAHVSPGDPDYTAIWKWPTDQ
jgi:hypothetical protein